MAGNTYGQADNPQCDVKGNLSEGVFVAYGPDAMRENAVLYQEHFSDAKGIITGYCQYASKQKDEMYGKLEYKQLNYYDDVSGKLSQRQAVVYQEGETIVCDYTYSYNEDGNLMTMSTKCDEDPNLIERKYEYDSSRKLIKESYYQNTKILTYTIIEYDPEGYKTKETDYSFNDEELVSIKFTYDSKGQLASKTQIENVEPQKKTEYTYTYDEQGKLQKEEVEKNFGPEEIRKTTLYYYALFSKPIPTIEATEAPTESMVTSAPIPTEMTTSGFEIILSISILSAVFLFVRKRR
ncbi:MAG: hypothetical protein ACTSQA_04140 [Candidatus Heimdallarchaeaceae archaeon]